MMNHSDQRNEIPVAYPHPLPTEGYPPPQVVAPPPPPPPPVGYPTKDAQDNINLQNVETQSRGDDFWKGCAAALCCCCVLDFCF